MKRSSHAARSPAADDRLLCGMRTRLTRDADILRRDAIPAQDGKWMLHHNENQKVYLYDVAARTKR